MSKGLLQSCARNTPHTADGRVSPVLWIRMLETMYVNGNSTALRVGLGALLRVQQGRDDRYQPGEPRLPIYAIRRAEDAPAEFEGKGAQVDTDA